MDLCLNEHGSCHAGSSPVINYADLTLTMNTRPFNSKINLDFLFFPTPMINSPLEASRLIRQVPTQVATL